MFEYMSSEMLRQNVEPACVEVKKMWKHVSNECFS